MISQSSKRNFLNILILRIYLQIFSIPEFFNFKKEDRIFIYLKSFEISKNNEQDRIEDFRDDLLPIITEDFYLRKS